MQQFYYYLPKGSFVRMLASKFPQTLVHTENKTFYKFIPMYICNDIYSDNNKLIKISHCKQNGQTVKISATLNYPEKELFEKTRITVRTDTIFINYAINHKGERFIGSGEVMHSDYSNKFNIQSYIYDIACNRRPDDIEKLYKELFNKFSDSEAVV
jgi:hypothetical protein